MEKRECKKCGKIIEGFTKSQVDYLMKQHQLSSKCKLKVVQNGKK